MSNFKFELKRVAYTDIETIADYIAQDNKSAAKNLIEKFYYTFELICSKPECGRILDRFPDKSVRFFVVKKHYLVIYRIEEDTIQILRVLTGYQDICGLF